jgi:hypothetical protein
VMPDVHVRLGGATGLGMTVAGTGLSGGGGLEEPSLTGRLQLGMQCCSRNQLGDRCIEGWPMVAKL